MFTFIFDVARTTKVLRGTSLQARLCSVLYWHECAFDVVDAPDCDGAFLFGFVIACYM